MDKTNSRVFLPHHLDEQMPADGWEYELVYRFMGGWECTVRVDLVLSDLNLYVQSPTSKAHPGDQPLSFRSAVSPVFVLAYFHAQQLELNQEASTIPSWWSDELKERVTQMAYLADFIHSGAGMPAEFLPQAACRLPNVRKEYDYRVGKYVDDSPTRLCTPEPGFSTEGVR
ncbi:hypothetical protein EYR36_001806 [Pleurotus pulmonarius]|nr:hypothetical protein EYR36_008252 [Pleurotus pulmonarius]KAF4579986.1 hypothetical protein EYR36_001806 [Pleurotus pulmonarius]